MYVAAAPLIGSVYGIPSLKKNQNLWPVPRQGGWTLPLCYLNDVALLGQIFPLWYRMSRIKTC